MRVDWRGQVIASKLKPHEDYCPPSLPPHAIKTSARAEGEDRKGRSYKPLPVEFRSGDFNYRQIARQGNAAIYEQRSKDSENVAYEVVRIRRRAQFEINGRSVEPAEVYPKSEAWGVDGFT